MPRKPLAQELEPLLRRVLADVKAVRDDVQGMHNIVLSRAIEDLVGALDVCHARSVPPIAAVERTTSTAGKPTAAAATPDLAAAAVPAKSRSRSVKASA